MYHFINQWDHIRNLQTASKLAIEVMGAPQDYNNLHLPKSQEVIGRLISFGIRCTWTEEEVRTLAANIATCVEKVLIKETA
jgi:8-amino-3,8-dideoxy-alpha-D-manno-octulosonate transaminase